MTKPALRTLIVDDYRPLCEVIAATMQSEGWLADIALNVPQALAKLDAFSYDLLIVDYHTGRSLGTPQTPALLPTARRKNPGLKIVTMSDGEPFEKITGVGHAFLAKPFGFRSLLAQARQLGFGMPSGTPAHAA